MNVAVTTDGRRNFCAPIDGVLEVRCPKKLDGVIAAARCLEQQGDGCRCARAVPLQVKHELAEAASVQVRGSSRERDEQIVGLLTSGRHPAQVAAEFNLSESNIRTILKNAGRHRLAQGERAHLDDVRQALRDAIMAGGSAADLAAEFGVSSRSVTRERRALRVAGRTVPVPDGSEDSRLWSERKAVDP